MTSTRSAADPGLPKPKIWRERQADAFEVRFAQWLELKAELSAFYLTVPGDDDDEKQAELSDRVDDAARLAMTTCVSKGHMIWEKIQIFEHALHGNGESQWNDNRQVWMFACIKADLMAIGIDGGNS